MKHCKTCNNYTDLFYQRQVYCDQPGPDCEVETSLCTEMRTPGSTCCLCRRKESSVTELLVSTTITRLLSRRSETIVRLDRAHNISVGQI